MKLPFQKYSLKKDANSALALIVKFLKLRVVKWSMFGLVILCSLPLIYFYYHRPKIQPNINYGITFSNKYTEEIGMDWHDTYMKIIDDLGAKNLRLVVYWEDVEKERDQYYFGDIKWQLEEAQKRDVNVILVLGRKVPRWPECFEPEWWKNLEDEDIKNQELYEFIKETVKELKQYSAIKMWQVENEPFFPFGECHPSIKRDVVKQEIKVVRELDDRPIIIQDSGEGGFWYPSYSLGDYLAISMYRKIWYDFWGVFFGKPVYFKYPLAHWTYKIKADLVTVPAEKIVVTELQAEPWGPRINSQLTQDEKDRTMAKSDFLDTISYAQKSGFKDLYLWGAEWWLWEKEYNNNPFFWETAKAIFRN